ncbi:ImmA/IrrE family metallo-endopeptidase [Sporosalibacterium faouarense]|uniref:ImmA/IrrE family metallo-endopeptidase n=1 Tax=Sporosalibacterium faouarense TaxID=516123 RepID=UPI00192C02C3|nr:ImmA/IrrE family metallo-endopeptidase [Sporosalibacterium faouarense]
MRSKLKILFDLCDEQGIIIDYGNLPNNVLGMYVKNMDMPAIIGIDRSIENNEEQLLIVLAEELGHHFTTTGEFVGPFFHYRDRLKLNKAELMAMKWAVRFLIPIQQLKDVLSAGSCSFSDIANKLQVPTEILYKRLELLSHKYQVIDIGYNQSLVLSNWPNVYVANRFN